MNRCLTLAALLALLAMAGCGGGGSETSAAGSAQVRPGTQARVQRQRLRRQAVRRARIHAARMRAAQARRRAAEERETASEESSESSECDPNYAGACLSPTASDYDCEGGSGDGPEYTGTVTVVGEDHYGLDSDGDGVGCE